MRGGRRYLRKKHYLCVVNQQRKEADYGKSNQSPPVLYGKDALRFEKEIREAKPLSKERREEMRRQYESFMSKVNIKIEKKPWI